MRVPLTLLFVFVTTILCSQEKPVTFKVSKNMFTTLSDIFSAAELTLQKGPKDPEDIKSVLGAKIDSYRASYPEDGAMKEFRQNAFTEQEFIDRLRKLPKGTKVVFEKIILKRAESIRKVDVLYTVRK